MKRALLVLILCCIAISAQCFRCDNGGYAVSNKTCDCPSIFYHQDTTVGDMCKERNCQLQDKSSNFTIENDTPTCSCDEDRWNGISCQMCASDSSCQSMVGHSYSKCDHDLVPRRHKYFECAMTNRKLADTFGDKVTLDCQKDGSDIQCNVQAWYKDYEIIEYIQSLYCSLKSCKVYMQGASRDIIYECKSSDCSCVSGSELCDDTVSSMLSGLKSKSTIRCDTDSSNCSFIHSEFPLELTFNCSASECVDKKDEKMTIATYYLRESIARFISHYLVTLLGALTLGIVFLSYALLWYNASVHKETIAFEMDLIHRKRMAGITIEVKDLGYKIQKKRNRLCNILRGDAEHKVILSNISTTINEGTITMIMGVSSAGKTTFVDILSGKSKPGKITGQVLYNGKPEVPKSDTRLFGYIYQEDNLPEEMTIEEYITHACRLKSPDNTSKSEITRLVDAVISDMGLWESRFTRICKLSGGEKRRVSIACEVVIPPSVLFMDEPSSSIDPVTELKIFDHLTTIRSKGCTIIIVIHSPNEKFFDESVDKVILMKDGSVVFDKSPKEIRHFLSEEGLITDDSVQGVPSPESILYALEGYDTACVQYNEQNGNMLIVDRETMASDLDICLHDTDVVDYNRIRLHGSDSEDEDIHTVNMDENLEDPIDILPVRSKELKSEDISPYVTSYIRQLHILMRYHIISMLRRKTLFMTHIATAIITSVISGIVYRGPVTSMEALLSRVGCIMFLCTMVTIFSLSSLVFFSSDESLYRKEVSNGYYRPSAYYLARTLIDAVLLRLIPCILLATLFYAFVGLRPGIWHFMEFVVIICQFSILSSSISMLIGTLIGDTMSSVLVSLVYLMFSSLFGGIIANKKTIPAYISWLRYFSHWNYSIEAILVNQYRGLPMGMQVELNGRSLPVDGDFCLRSLGMDSSALNYDFSALALMTVIVIAISTVCFTRRSKTSR